MIRLNVAILRPSLIILNVAILRPSGISMEHMICNSIKTVDVQDSGFILPFLALIVWRWFTILTESMVTRSLTTEVYRHWILLFGSPHIANTRYQTGYKVTEGVAGAVMPFVDGCSPPSLSS